MNNQAVVSSWMAVPDSRPHLDVRQSLPSLARLGAVPAGVALLLAAAPGASAPVLLVTTGFWAILVGLIGGAPLLGHTGTSGLLRRLLPPALGLVTTLPVLAWSFGLAPSVLPIVARLLLAVILIAWLVDAMARLLTRRLPDHAAAAWSVFLLVLLGSLPVWGSGLATIWPWGGLTANILVSASPLSYLAEAAGWSYLHSDWFYRSSALGTMRFDYPAFWAQSLACVTLALALEGLARYRVAGPIPHQPNRSI